MAIAAASLAEHGAGAARDIVRCKDARGAVTYEPAPCPERTEESRPHIATRYPEPNRAESQRIFEREAALDKQLAVLAAQAVQPQYVIAYPLVARHWVPGHRRVAALGATKPQTIFR